MVELKTSAFNQVSLFRAIKLYTNLKTITRCNFDFFPSLLGGSFLLAFFLIQWTSSRWVNYHSQMRGRTLLARQISNECRPSGKVTSLVCSSSFFLRLLRPSNHNSFLDEVISESFVCKSFSAFARQQQLCVYRLTRFLNCFVEVVRENNTTHPGYLLMT